MNEFKRGWPVVLASTVGLSLGGITLPYMTMGVLAPALAQEHGWTFAQIMAGLLVMTSTLMVVGPVLGAITDRLGVRPVAISSMVLFALAFASFGLNTGSLALYYANWAAVGVAGAGTSPITWSRGVNGWFVRQRGLALGLASMGPGLSTPALKGLAAWLIANYGVSAAYFGLGALPLVIALPIAWMGLRDRKKAEVEIDLPAAGPGPATSAEPSGKTVGEALRGWRIWLLAGAFLMISFAVSGPIPNFENILKQAHFSMGDAVAVASILGLAALIGKGVGGWCLDRIWAPLVGFVILCFCIWALWMLGRPTLSGIQAVTAALLLGLSGMVQFSLLPYLVARYFGLRHYGAIFGGLYGADVVAGGLGTVFYGNVFDRSGSYEFALQVSMALALAGGSALLAMGRYPGFPRTARTGDDGLAVAPNQRALT